MGWLPFSCFHHVMTHTPAVRKQDRRAAAWSEFRLRRHSDFQRVYAGSRKRFSDSMTYFFARRPEPVEGTPARVGLTAGRVLGKAVERNRIKRRMREAVRKHISQLPQGVDVVLHPRRKVMTMDFAALEREVGAVFARIAGQLEKNGAGAARPEANLKSPDGADGPDGRVRP
jgi:ribonuclease P protein component